mgnify:CR=1 FL=1
MTKSYDDIIEFPHHVSDSRPQMSRIDRAAQFSPFAALTGYETAVRETARLTDARKELDENVRAILDDKLQIIQEHLTEQPELTITYFKPDERKSGGSYIDITGCVKKIDFFEYKVIMQDGMEISVEDIFEIACSLFDECYDF